MLLLVSSYQILDLLTLYFLFFPCDYRSRDLVVEDRLKFPSLVHINYKKTEGKFHENITWFVLGNVLNKLN